MIDMESTVIQGDCREILPTLLAESIHCVVTSPPYWGMRDYGIPPNIWGGDPNCKHVWGEKSKSGRTNRNGVEGGIQSGRHKNELVNNIIITPETGAFCKCCGAWCGSFGLEPTIDLYVEHAVEIFRAVRRVLRPDGTLWLNLGDSYNANQGKGFLGQRLDLANGSTVISTV